jgi:hypothetical protein
VGAYKSGTNGLNTCSNCPEGRYGQTGTPTSSINHCAKCPAGKYQDIAAATACYACPGGRYGQFPGETEPNCTARCPTELLASCQSSEGTASPISPEVGHYIANFTTKIQKACPAGKHKPTLDFGKCSSCSSGRFQDKTGKAFCNEGTRFTWVRNNVELRCPDTLADEASCGFGSLEYKNG